MKKENDIVIEIKNVSKEYKIFDRKKDRLLEAILPKYEKDRVFRPVDNMNLTVKKGEILGILGKNGSGKSKEYRVSENAANYHNVKMVDLTGYTEIKK